VVDSKKNRK